MAIKSIKEGHGLSGSGLGHPLESGCVGPETKFTGRTMPQDTDRKAGDMGEVGEVGNKKVPKNVGIKKPNTGGMSRLKSGASGVGPFKAKGTN